MDQVEEIRSKTDLVQLISEYLPLKKSGRNFQALCPFHSEKAPSFIVSPERQIWKCFGCALGGDVFGFLMEYEKMEFGEALRMLAKRVGVQLRSYRSSASEAEKEKLYEINHLASEFYHYLLVSHPVGKRALNYLLGRGIKKESLLLFKLGYAPSLLDGLQKFLVGKKGYKPEELQKAGLTSRFNYQSRDFFRDRIVFPLSDHRGNAVGFAGRVLDGDGPKYINISETLVYHKADLLYGLEKTREEIKAAKKAIIVEGELDLISSHQAGVKNVVAIKGSALTESQARLLKRFCDGIVFALDQDLAGDAAARRGVEVADAVGLDIEVVEIPEGKDPDELAQKNPAAWKRAVEQRIGVYDFFIDSAFTRFDGQTVLGKKKIAAEILPVFAKIVDEVVKAHYLRLLAKKLGVPEEALLWQISKQTEQKAGKASVQPVLAETKKSRQEVLEEYFFSLILQKGDYQGLLGSKMKKLVETPALKRMLAYFEKFFEKKKKFASEKFAQTLPPELLEIFNNFYLFDFEGKTTDERWFEQEKKRIILVLERIFIQEALKKLSLEIKEFEKKEDEKGLEKTKEKFTHLSRKLAGLG